MDVPAPSERSLKGAVRACHVAVSASQSTQPPRDVGRGLEHRWRAVVWKDGKPDGSVDEGGSVGATENREQGGDRRLVRQYSSLDLCKKVLIAQKPDFLL